MQPSTTPPLDSQSNSAALAAPLLTRKDAAQRLAMCQRAVDEIIASGGIKIVTIGRSVRIRPSDLEAFIEARATRRGQGLTHRKASQ